MLPRIRQIRRVLGSRTLARAISSSSDLPYHPKVKAYPFAVTQDEAINRMGLLASACCFGVDLTSSLAAYFLPDFGFKTFMPQQIQRVYVPAWIVDARIEANVTSPRVQGVTTSPQKSTVALENSYMPGLVFDPLHRISFNDPSLFQSDPIPFNESLLEHEGSEVLCPPYTISPLALPGFLRSLSPEQTDTNWGRVDPVTIEAPFIAAYPVLIPIYLAYYEVNSPDAPLPGVIMMLEAYRKDGRMFTHRVLDRIYESAKWLAPYVEIPRFDVPPEHEFLPMASITRIELASPFVQILGAIGVQPSREQSTEKQVNAFITRKETMENLERFVKEAGAHSVDFEDLRIREFTAEERGNNRDYLTSSLREAFHQHLAEAISEISGTSHEGDGSGDSRTGSGNGGLRSTGKRFSLDGSLMQQVDSTSAPAPEWLKQWEAQQKSSFAKKTDAKRPKRH